MSPDTVPGCKTKEYHNDCNTEPRVHANKHNDVASLSNGAVVVVLLSNENHQSVTDKRLVPEVQQQWRDT